MIASADCLVCRSSCGSRVSSITKNGSSAISDGLSRLMAFDWITVFMSPSIIVPAWEKQSSQGATARLGSELAVCLLIRLS